MPQRLRRAIRSRRRLTVGLWGLVALAWGAGIIVDALNLPEHVFADCRTIALASTIAALNSLVVGRLDQVNDRLDRAHQAMARLYRDAPGPDVTPLPWPGLRSVGADDAPALRPGRPASL